MLGYYIKFKNWKKKTIIQEYFKEIKCKTD